MSNDLRETRPHPRVVVRPPSGWQALELRELWRYRELIFTLAARDIRVRYKQTLLGASWAVLQPLFTMIVFSLLFGRLAGFDRRVESGVPYALYTLCAVLPWQLFTTALVQTGNSLVSNQHLVTKVYFPRLAIPIASLLASAVDFAVGLGLLVLLAIGYAWNGATISLGWPTLLLPAFIALAFACSLAVGLWLSALNVEYRDVRHAIPFLAQAWLFLTPVAYPSSLLRDHGEWLYTLAGLNPMTGVVEGFRWSLLGTRPPSVSLLVLSLAVTALLLGGGLLFFRRVESSFADVV